MNKTTFASRLILKGRRTAEPGKRMQLTREMVIDENGHKTLKITGEEDIYEFIQASLEESKIENILKRATGEDLMKMALSENDIVDITGAPTTLAEAQSLIEATRNSFEKLPPAIKEKFNFSAEEYVAQYGSQKWMDALGLNQKQNNGGEIAKESKKETKEVSDNGTNEKH